MVVDKAFVEYLRETYQMNIPKELEAFLLEEYCEEPFPYEYSEQDLYEQIRKLGKKYHDGLLNVVLKGSEYQLKQRYEALKDEYIVLTREKQNLEDEVEKLKGMLLKQGLTLTNLVKKTEEYDFWYYKKIYISRTSLNLG